MAQWTRSNNKSLTDQMLIAKGKARREATKLIASLVINLIMMAGIAFLVTRGF